MNKEIIKDEIKWLLEAINEQYEAIHRHGEKIPQIEFDILMDNVRKFYENMHLLQRLNEPQLFLEKKLKPVEPGQAGTIITPESKVVVTPPVSTPVQPVKQPVSGVTVTFSEPDEVPAEPEKPDDTEVFPVHSSPVQFKPGGPAAVRQEAPSAVKKGGRLPEIDLFAAEEPVFSIKLKEAREKTFGPKIPSERIDNLKTAITINEKFMFINELFDGNLREYNETIETLNGFKNLDQAADFLDLMRKKNFWNTGSNAFKKIKELVERRF
jgi:hypothetical protein